MTLYQLIIVILIINQEIVGYHKKYQIRTVQVVFYHGEKVPRTEFESYPNDPHKSYSFFPIEDGLLTNIGRNRMYYLGQKLRMVYGHLISEYYLPTRVYVRVTSEAISKMSAQLVMAGLFPPVGGQIWSKDIAWQPFIFIDKSTTYDTLFFPSTCRHFEDGLREAINKTSVKETNSLFLPIMKYISDHAGVTIQTYFQALNMHNLFVQQEAHNLTLPSWTKEIYPDKLKEITRQYLELRSCTPHLRRYNGGFFLKEFVEHMRHDATLGDAKIRLILKIYSGTEYNIIALTNTLGMTFPVLPVHGTAFIFESLRDENNRYYVNLVMWSGDDQALVVPVPTCSLPCPIEELVDRYGEFIPTDKELQACQNGR